jgi:hypothetical protein
MKTPNDMAERKATPWHYVPANIARQRRAGHAGFILHFSFFIPHRFR